MRYVLQEKFVSLRDAYTIKTEAGKPAFTITSKLFVVRKAFVMEDSDGTSIATIKRKWISMTPSYIVYFSDGSQAKIRQAYLRFGRGLKLIINSAFGRIIVAGDFRAREYQFGLGGDRIAASSRRWGAMTDTYGVEIESQKFTPLILCCVLVIDQYAAHQKAIQEKGHDPI